MPLDGTFIHYLLSEIEPVINKGLINKIHQISSYEFIFNIRANFTNHQLYINVGPQNSRLHLTTKKYDNPPKPYNYCMLLRKYLERGIIEKVEQIGNDRQIRLTISSYNDLEDITSYHLYIELTGKSSNLVLTTSNDIIIDATRKVSPLNETTRIILPKAHYELMNSNQVNPFNVENNLSFDNLEGCSKDLLKEFNYQNSIQKVLNQPLNPVIYHNQKRTFYAFPLKHIEAEFEEFDSLSHLLDNYFITSKTETNSEFAYIEKIVKREITKKKNKLANLNDDLAKANTHLEDNTYGVLLQANMYLLKPRMSSITLPNYLNNYEEVEIPLDPLLSPSENLKKYFKNAKKAQTALLEIAKQIEITNDEIEFLENIFYQLPFLTQNELEDVKDELYKNHYLHQYKKGLKKNKKLSFLTYNIDGVDIIIGKNNLQNDYLSNKLARGNDYWFHVKDMPGSHVIVRSSNLTEKIIRFAANAAAYYSKGTLSSSVAVDYTMVKNLKKIPKTKGYHLTYSTNKTIYIDPNLELLNSEKAIYR